MAAPALWSPPKERGTPETIGLWNALTSHLGQRLPLRGGAAMAEQGEAPAADALCLMLRFAAGPRIVLRPVAFPFTAAFDADLAVDDLPLLPEALRDALLDALVATFAAALPEPGLGAVTIERRGELDDLLPPPARDALRWFRVTLQQPAGEPAVALVGAPLSTLAEIFGGSLGRRPIWPGLAQTLTREVAVTLGRLTLDATAARGLVPGAVVVLDGAVRAGAARLRLGAELFHFEARDQGWACLAVTSIAERHTGGTMDTSRDLDAGSREGGRLEVAVDLDLGSVTVPVAEIEGWQVGSVVALQPPTPREGVEVALRVNGRLIGTGELVRVDDRLAVRIARLSLA